MKTKWRDASKELPPESVVVLISTEGETQAQDVWLGQHVGGRWRYPYSEYFVDLNVTHWMNLPKAPTDEVKRRNKTVTDLITEFADEITRETKTKKTKKK